MTTDISINHPIIIGRKIPAIACTINSESGEEIITAIARNQMEILEVYRRLFLDRIVPNRENRFVCVHPSDFGAVHVARIGVLRTDEPVGALFRVLCIYTGAQNLQSRASSDIDFLFEELGLEVPVRDETEDRTLCNAMLCINSVNFDNPAGERDIVAIKYDILSKEMARLNENILSATTGLTRPDGTREEGLGHNRIAYLQMISRSKGSGFFLNRLVEGVFSESSTKKMAAMKTELFPPPPENSDRCMLM